MTRKIFIKRLIIFGIISWNYLFAQQISIPDIPFLPESYVCYRTDGIIYIDGKPDEASWERAEWTNDFVDIEGPSKPLPRFRTRVKMLWDTSYFYIAADIEEPDVWANLTEHDAIIFYDNDFEVFIDPDGDTHNYYELEMNAFNTVWELLLIKPYRDGGPAVHEWDIDGLKTGTHVRGTVNRPGDRDEGWSVEIAIPWSALKECANRPAPPVNGDQWRVNFSRVEWKTEILNGIYQKVKNEETGKPYPEDNWVWTPQGLINMHYPEMWGFIQFSEKIVGTSVDTFISRSEEKVKWLLRQIYYAEKNYFIKNGAYTDNLFLLQIPDISSEKLKGSLRISRTPNLFEAIRMSDENKTEWHIDQDGRTWK